MVQCNSPDVAPAGSACRARTVKARTGWPVFLALIGLLGSSALAQQRPEHYFHAADMPPGAIGYGQLLRGGPLPGYFQPVELQGPRGSQIALAVDGLFDAPQATRLKAGLLVGRVYRLKVTNIPNQEGREVFPSIEIINRLYPPPGQEARFPIPVQLTREELELALNGHFVIRVIYLEDPRTALPRRQEPGRQWYFEVSARQDPLYVADRLGRPMAILRMGSRLPDVDQATGRFLFDSPPWIRLPRIVAPGDQQIDAPTRTASHQMPARPEREPVTRAPATRNPKPQAHAHAEGKQP